VREREQSIATFGIIGYIRSGPWGVERQVDPEFNKQYLYYNKYYLLHAARRIDVIDAKW